MNGKIKVLLVEDEETLAMILKDTLDAEGFDVFVSNNGDDGLKSFFNQKPDVIIADIMMPLIDGYEMVSKIRQADKSIPILFLTARSAVKDVVKGFELGATDYLKKPFNMQELIVRIKALVGRMQIVFEKERKSIFNIGAYTFNSTNQILFYGNDKISLSHRESEILKYLSSNKGGVIETQNILLDLWGDDNFFNTKSLHVFITKLRKKLSLDSSIKIINIKGVGYKMIDDQSEI